jgi:hypothetical protein
MVAPVATSPLTFAPGDTLAEEILIDLSAPDASLSSVAAKHNLPTATLSLWLTKPQTQALLHSIESGGYAHTRLAAALNLSSAVPILLQILSDFRTLAATTTDLTDPAYQRASVGARKAAWMLQRLARSCPLTPVQLNAALDTLDATRAANPPQHPAQPAPAVPIQIAPAAPTPIAPLQTPTPAARTEPVDAQPAPAAITHSEPAPTATAHTHPASNTPAPLASTTPHTDPARHDPVPHTQLNTANDLADLVAHLSSIAESLGIDISDLDEIAENMLQNATGPPPAPASTARQIA